MKICITSIGDNLESQLDPRFGRCRNFIIWNFYDNAFEAIANPYIDASSGAGIQAAQLVVSKGVSTVITGEVGPKAEQVLNEANLKIIKEANTDVSVNKLLEKYVKNGLQDEGAW